MKENIILLVNGVGGHKEQMNRLVIGNRLLEKTSNVKYIQICEYGASIEGVFKTYEVMPSRDKYSKIISIYYFLKSIIKSLLLIVHLLNKYKIVGLLSTGPGIVILPAIIMRLFGIKVVFIETWSRFTSKSYTGMFMHKIANKFYIQNKSLEEIYINSIYAGRL